MTSITQLFGLDGKTAVVTGASYGLGVCLRNPEVARQNAARDNLELVC
jgi:short-subunit dehydrogenase